MVLLHGRKHVHPHFKNEAWLEDQVLSIAARKAHRREQQAGGSAMSNSPTKPLDVFLELLSLCLRGSKLEPQDVHFIFQLQRVQLPALFGPCSALQNGRRLFRSK